MKKKKEVKREYNYKKTFLVFTIVFSIIIAISTYWIYAYKHKHPYLEENIINYKIDDYVITKGNIVYLENINEEVKTDFINKQNKIINSNNIIDIDIVKTIYKNILSIKITYILSDISNYEEVLTLNYNLVENKIEDNTSLLENATAYRLIAEAIFDNYVRLDNDNIKVIDAITNEELTGKEFNNNSYKYITRIRENLPDIINLYIKDNKLYYIVKVEDINKLCYLTKIKVNSSYINEEIDKL